jgi:hypothetical protein
VQVEREQAILHLLQQALRPRKRHSSRRVNSKETAQVSCFFIRDILIE